MKLAVTYPTRDLGTDPGVLKEWAQGVEGIGFDEILIPEPVQRPTAGVPARASTASSGPGALEHHLHSLDEVARWWRNDIG